MRYGIEQIEDLLIARVKAGLPYLGTVDTYERKYGENLEQLLSRSPAVFLYLEGVAPDEGLSHMGGQAWVYTFQLGVICRDLRGPREGRRGEEGAYRIIGDLHDALEGHRLAQGLEPLEMEGVEFVLSTNIGVVYQVAYSLSQAGG